MNAWDELLSFQKELGVKDFYIDGVKFMSIPFMGGMRKAVIFDLLLCSSPNDPVFDKMKKEEVDYVFFKVFTETSLKMETDKYKVDRWTYSCFSGTRLYYDPKDCPDVIKIRARM